MKTEHSKRVVKPMQVVTTLNKVVNYGTKLIIKLQVYTKVSTHLNCNTLKFVPFGNVVKLI